MRRGFRIRYALTITALLMSHAISTNAQTTVVTNPSILEFTVSPDHNAVDVFGQSIVTSYDYAAIAQNTLGAIAITVGIGKPVASDGATVQLPLPGLALLVVNSIYTATLDANGPGGASGPSLPSNPFGVAGPV